MALMKKKVHNPKAKKKNKIHLKLKILISTISLLYPHLIAFQLSTEKPTQEGKQNGKTK